MFNFIFWEKKTLKNILANLFSKISLHQFAYIGIYRKCGG